MEWASALTDDSEPLSYYRVIEALNTCLDLENSIVTHDAAPRDAIVPFYTATAPNSMSAGARPPISVSAFPDDWGKMAAPDKFCLNLMGDGAGMSGTDVETAARAGIAITTVLLNNSAMATYSDPPRAPSAPPPARFGYRPQGDYAKIAEGMGATGLRVTTVGELTEALPKPAP